MSEPKSIRSSSSARVLPGYRQHLRSAGQPRAAVHRGFQRRGPDPRRAAHVHHRGRELPGLPRGSRRPGADGPHARAGRAAGHAHRHRRRARRWTSRAIRSACGSARARSSRRRRSSSRPAHGPTGSGCPTRSASAQGGGVSAARCATEPSRSTATGASSWWAAATARWRRPRTSRATPASVVIVHRRDTFRASKVMAARVAREPEDPRPRVATRDEVVDVLGDDSITGVRVEDEKTGDRAYPDAPASSSPSGTRPTPGSSAASSTLAGQRLPQAARPGSTWHQRARRVRRRRRDGLDLPAGGHGRGHGLHGGAGGRAVAGEHAT